ncbi:MAG: nucleotidyltransferase [Archaeoglobaceae archaeon]|nr:nucleotidyltransferase [Archaeoglobaceae archaeon]
MINEQQLQIWAKAPSPTEMERIKHTRQIIENALRKYLPIEDIKRRYEITSFQFPEIYLQGSYANSTNVRFDSDVDIVVQLNSVFWSDKTQLSDTEKLLYELSFSNSKYKFIQFKQDVFEALVKAFGSSDVTYSAKCLKVKKNTNRVNADVVPCFQYRVYKRFISYNNQYFIEGMKFLNTENLTEIINFPKKHLENCKSKNVDTDGKFKSMIRIFKNMRNNLIDKGVINDKIAPSYFIENMLYNCTSPCFDGTLSECMIKTLQFLFDALKSGRISGFICANEQDSLFGPKTWNVVSAQTFILAIADYYLNDN